MAVLIFLILTFIYLTGVSPAVFGGDAGDIILSYSSGGVAHPPGYPLNTLLGFILTKVLPGPTFAFKADLVAAIYQAAVVSLVYLIIKNLTKNGWVAVAGALTLGFTPLFWLYAHVAEVFQLTLLLIAASVLSLFRWFLASQKNFKYLYLSVFLFGLAVFHHQTPIFLVFAYFFLFWRKKLFSSYQICLKLLLVFLLGVLPYAYLPVVQNIPTNWGDVSSLEGVWRLVTRGDYGTFTASPELVGVSGGERLTHVWWYLNTIRADFTYLGLALAAVGAIWLFARRRDWFWFLTLAWFFSGPFFVAYAAFPPVEAFLRGISERFYLSSYLFLAIVIGAGMQALFNLSVLTLNLVFAQKRLLALFVGGLFLFFPIMMALLNFPKTDLSDFKVGQVLALDILGNVDPAGILFLQGDTATFSVQYSYYVDQVNPGAVLVMSGRMRHPSYRQKLQAEYPNLSYPGEFTREDVSFEDAVVKFIDNNFGKWPIYSLEKLPLPQNYVWIQEGLILRLYKKDYEPSSATVAATIDQKMKKLLFEEELTKKRYLNFFEEHIRVIYSRFYTRNGIELIKHGEVASAIPYLLRAVVLEENNREALYWLGVAYLELGDCQKAMTAFERIIAFARDYWQAFEGLGKVYDTCFKDQDKASSYYQKSKEARQRLFDEPI